MNQGGARVCSTVRLEYHAPARVVAPPAVAKSRVEHEPAPKKG